MYLSLVFRNHDGECFALVIDVKIVAINPYKTPSVIISLILNATMKGVVG